MSIRQALKEAKLEGKTNIKLNQSKEDLKAEIIRIILPMLKPVTNSKVPAGSVAIQISHPEYGAKWYGFIDGSFQWGLGCNSIHVSYNDDSINSKEYRDVSELPYDLSWTELF